ncbi:polypeptide N-acetylgalactosaminyltransferase 16 [Crotalus adamanteus]|uniref:Polypeptide N-acetylgalactosaminyltransferase 16 n=1 Tax=Crotalus adamanteus TaxID=8729 RepID=A0AAW1C5X8_CROAD
MRRIRANAIAILTVAWILGTFYYLWQDSKPHSAASSRSPSSGGGGVVVKSGQRSSGKVELHKEERTVPLLVSVASPLGSRSPVPARGWRFARLPHCRTRCCAGGEGGGSPRRCGSVGRVCGEIGRVEAAGGEEEEMEWQSAAGWGGGGGTARLVPGS